MKEPQTKTLDNLHEDTVKYIVGTYELQPRTEDWIVRAVNTNLNNLNISGFNAIYEYVADFIPKIVFNYNNPLRYFREKGFLSLDKKISDSVGDNEFHELIGIDDQDSKSEEEPGKPTIRLSYAFGVLEERLGERYRQLLSYLREQNNNSMLNISEEEFLDSIPQIRERLEELADRYEKDGRIVIPSRRIVRVQFSPLKVVFGNRRYNGNPLAFFRAHTRAYEGMSRTDLADFDKGLYESLRKYSQLSEAIPKYKSGYKILNKKHQAIVQRFKECRSCSQVADEFEVSLSTVLRHCNKDGLKNTRKVSEQEKMNMVQEYLRCRNAKKVGKKLGRSPSTVCLILTGMGIEMQPRFGLLCKERD